MAHPSDSRSVPKNRKTARFAPSPPLLISFALLPVKEIIPMNPTRRGFLAAAGAAAAGEQLSHAETPQQDHDHQALPSDPALRVKALESLLVEKGLVDPAAV